jgi:hypothetical protein
MSRVVYNITDRFKCELCLGFALTQGSAKRLPLRLSLLVSSSDDRSYEVNARTNVV